MIRQHRSQAGFTLLEMMAALTAGLIAVASIYTLSSASSKHFHEQQRISQTQMSLRMAMSRLSHDIARAGFGSTPSSVAEGNLGMLACNQTPTNPLHAIQFADNLDGASAIPNAAANGSETDRIDLLGNFATSDVYRAMPTPANNAVSIQSTWHAFARSFGIPGDATRPYNQAAFEDVFQDGRLIHIRTTDQKHFYARIISSNGTLGAFSVTFSPSFNCQSANLDGAMISPINRIRYRVVGPNGGANSALAGLSLGGVPMGTATAGTENSILIREELNETGARIAGTEQIVLEYVANVDYQFIVDTQLTPGAPPVLAMEQDNPTPNVTNFAHRIRSVVINLAARTIRHDPAFGPAAAIPMRTFRVNNVLPGAARVRTLRSEVMLRNMPVLRP